MENTNTSEFLNALNTKLKNFEKFVSEFNEEILREMRFFLKAKDYEIKKIGKDH